MGEASSQIEQEIEQTRAQLGSNLEELEHKVKNMTDWRWQFQQNPGLMLGLAFVAGILLANLIPPRARTY